MEKTISSITTISIYIYNKFGRVVSKPEDRGERKLLVIYCLDFLKEIEFLSPLKQLFKKSK